jgi:NADH-quinone oxidoreductase subunit F
MPGIFAGGDAVLGPATVIECIAQGRQAAISIDKYLGGSGEITEILAAPEVPTSRNGGPLEGFRPANAAIAHEKRLHSFEGVEIGWSQEEAIEECSRCLRCDLTYKPEKADAVYTAVYAWKPARLKPSIWAMSMNVIVIVWSSRHWRKRNS